MQKGFVGILLLIAAAGATLLFLTNFPQLHVSFGTIIPILTGSDLTTPGVITLESSETKEYVSHYGDTNVTFLSFTITNSDIEDVQVKSISIPLYSTDFFEHLSERSLSNIHLLDNNGKILSSTPITFQPGISEGNTISYAIFPVNLTLKKEEKKKLSLTADIPEESTAGIVARIPAYTNYDKPELHFETLGKTSGEEVSIQGDVWQYTYFRPRNGKAALVLSDIEIAPTPLPAYGTNNKLATISFTAQEEEDIVISKIGNCRFIIPKRNI